MLYFWKAKGPRTSKMIFWTVSWWFKDVKNDNLKYSDLRYTVDFCSVPPGLFLFSLTFLFLSLQYFPNFLFPSFLFPSLFTTWVWSCSWCRNSGTPRQPVCKRGMSQFLYFLIFEVLHFCTNFSNLGSNLSSVYKLYIWRKKLKNSS